MVDIPGNLWASINGTGNANFAGAATDLFSGIGSIASGFAGAAASKDAATMYTNAVQFTKEQTAMKEAMATRSIYQANSAVKADVAGNGFQLSGSAGDILRSTTAQGALTHAAIQQQGAAQESTYEQQAKAAKDAAAGQKTGGILGALGSVAAMFL